MGIHAHDAAEVMGGSGGAEVRIALVVSRNPRRTDDAEWEAWLERGRRAVETLSDGQHVDVHRATASAHIATGYPRSDVVGQLHLYPSSARAMDVGGRRMLLGGQSRLANLQHDLAAPVPPFGYLCHDSARGACGAGTDVLGLQHIYVGRADGLHAASTSSTLLACLAAAPIDHEACQVYSLLGCFLGEQTMFSGVRKLAAGEQATLEGGGLATRVPDGVVPRAVSTGDTPRALSEVVASGQQALHNVLVAFRHLHEEEAETHLELSGGLDSRLLLASTLDMGWPGLRTLTIGDPGSGDVEVGLRLARRYGLEASFVPFSVVADWGPEEAWARVRQAARHRDFASNPLTAALYEHVAELVPATVQLTGQGGELGRGSYYAGQREQAGVDAAKAESLVRWRLAVNQATDGRLLASAARQERQHVLRDQVWQHYFRDRDGMWPAVTDHIYLFGRMQRWAGPTYSSWATRRNTVAPFFHPAYVEWARDVPMALKRNSRTFVGILQALAPELAVAPLASGLRPTDVSSTSMRARSRRLVRDVRRAQRKVRQRVAGHRHAPGGVAGLVLPVVEGLRQGTLAELASVDWLDQTALERLHAGDQTLDVVSAAFLVNLAGAVTAVRSS